MHTPVDDIILSSLVFDEPYLRRVFPFLKEEYFPSQSKKIVFNTIQSYIAKYNNPPSKEALLMDLSNREDLNENTFKECSEYVAQFEKNDSIALEYKLDQTEKFCQDRAIYNAIMGSIQIIDGRDKKADRGTIPKLLSDALGVSFDSNIGHDFLEDVEKRYEFYHRQENRVPFDLEYFNKITQGGLPPKTLNVALAGTNVGKSLLMCHMAAANLARGYNVLYITLELSEERVAERIDANLTGTTLEDLKQLDYTAYKKKVDRVKNKTTGKLIIKEYPTASAHAGHFRHLLNELKLKINFKPDIIYIDYINICTSSRLKMGGSVNSYGYIKAIAEEIRGLAQEFNLPIFTATQATRSGHSNSDIAIEDTSESWGLPQTADFMFALVNSEELQELGQYMVKQLKSRYGDASVFRKFVIGVDRSRMRLYDVEQSAQEDIVDTGPAFDNTTFGKRMSQDKSGGKTGKSKFANFT